MKKAILITTIILTGAMALPLSACLDEKAPVPNLDTSDWDGKWIGPEGTLLELAPKGENIDVAITSLDGKQTYEGHPTEDGIEFMRDKKMEVIRAGDGHDTGMKWLLDKQNCLYIKTGEGFCRD